MQTIQERFESKYIPEPNSGCWLWLGTLGEYGHGWFWANGKTISPHIFSYQNIHGQIEKESQLIHKCKTSCCVNPDHLIAIKTNEGRLCKACGEFKKWEDWTKNKAHLTSYSSYCKKCTNNRVKQYSETHKEEIKVRNKKWRLANKDKIIADRQIYKPKLRLREQTDPILKLKKNLRSRMGMAIKKNSKSGSAVQDLGCSIEELKVYLEAKFQPGMTWENHATNGWHIDHIKPLNSFDLSNREQFLEACHYTNLQPLWAKDNLSKGAKETYQLMFEDNNA